MGQKCLDFKYILFCHYNSDGKEKPTAKKDPKPVDFLSRYKKRLKDLLDDQHYPGLLVLFWHPGWLELLNTISADFNPDKFAVEYRRSERQQNEINTLLNSIEISVPLNCKTRYLNERIRFVIAQDLYKIINNLRGDRLGSEAKRLRKFLSGDVPRTLYDTPKVVEAIVHARHIGMNIPIFRLDRDVLFNDYNLSKKDNKGKCVLHHAIKKAVQYYAHYNDDSHIYSFLFSASYTKPNTPIKKWTLDEWMGAFSTRLFPALLADDKLLNEPSPVPLDVNELELNKSDWFDLDVTQKFYGIDANGIISNPNTGISEIGSDPLEDIISGALLCMSDGAMLDLPPASNFDKNVSWIDDYLKYSLHEELKHLESYEICGQLTQSRRKRIPDCQVKKERPPTKDIAQYILGFYLPTLVSGCIFDRWIKGDKKGDENTTGVLTEALQKSLERGCILGNKKLNQLREDMEEEALQRLEQIRDKWSQLKGKNDKDTLATSQFCTLAFLRGTKTLGLLLVWLVLFLAPHTFASLWVTDPEHIKREYKYGSDKKREDPGKPFVWGLIKDDSVQKITSKDDLNPAIYKLIQKLIEDAINYIEWCLEWPKFIQSVRAIKPGSLNLDVTWSPEKESQ